VSFLSNGNRLLSAADDKTLRIWSLEGGSEKILRGHRALIYQVAVSPDGRLAASASADRTVRVWDLGSGSLIGVHQHEADVKQLAFSPDGQYLLSVSDDQTARLWRAREIQEIPGAIEGLGSWLSSVTRLDISSESE
jgi:WD40 repeat protein